MRTRNHPISVSTILKFFGGGGGTCAYKGFLQPLQALIYSGHRAIKQENGLKLEHAYPNQYGYMYTSNTSKLIIFEYI